MRKVIVLIIMLFLLGGCYDYKEINDLAIVSAIGIDYIDESYLVTLEILKDDQDKDSSGVFSFIKIGVGKTLTDAIENASDKITKGTNFSHVKLMVLSKSLMKENFDNIIDLFLRNTYFRENFYVLGSDKNSPEEILSNKSLSQSSASEQIVKMFQNMNYSSNSNVLKEYNKLVKDYLDFGIDICFSNVSIIDNEFVGDGLVIFDNDNYKNTLNNSYAKLYNILSNNFERVTYSINYNNKFFTVAINNGKVDVNINNGKIIVSGNLMGRIIDNDTDFDIRDNKTLKKIDSDFSVLINELVEDFIKKMQKENSDLLGISSKYYKRSRIKDDDYWKYLDVNSNINFNLNKKGLIYEK